MTLAAGPDRPRSGHARIRLPRAGHLFASVSRYCNPGALQHTLLGYETHVTLRGVSWLLLTYRLPVDRSSARVAVWREVRRSGALQLQQSVVVLPDTDEFRRVLARLRAAVAQVGGSVVAVQAEPLDSDDDARLAAAWNDARAAEYSELAAESDKLVAEIDKEFAKEKFTLAELDEEEAELEKLRSWHKRIRARDVRGCDGAPEAEAALERAAEAVSRYTAAVFDRTTVKARCPARTHRWPGGRAAP